MFKWNEIHQFFFKNPIKPGGQVTLPTAPGLGMELDSAKIENQREISF